MEKTLKDKNILLMVLWLFVTVHLLKDFTQDILHISTILDKLGDIQEDLSWLPGNYKLFYLYSLGSLSILAELIIVAGVPFIILKTASKKIKWLVKVSLLFLLAFFLIAMLLDPANRLWGR